MIKIIENSIEMASIAPAWNELADQSKNPLLRHEWFAACAEAFCLPGQLRVVINNSEEGIAAIAPLALSQQHGLASLELLGASILDEPTGFLYKDAGSLNELLTHILSMRKPVILNRLKSESPKVMMLRGLNKKGSFIIMRSHGSSPFLPVSTTWAEFEASMSSRHRYDLRRARMRAETFGKVQVEIESPDPDTLDHRLKEIYEVEAAGWKRRKGTAMLQDGRLKRFFHAYSTAACGLGKLRLGYLRINDKPAAVMLAVEYYNRFWVLKIGYDEAFSRCSPGILLVHETIRYAHERGLDAYEFLGSEAPWIRMWTQQLHPYVTARIYPYSISGQIGLSLDVASSIMRKAAKLV
jgi:CelD/BcsL family acetyltransferase involved in cellulose biosynthesis